MRSLSLRSGNSPTTPYGGRVNGLQIIGFPPPCHPNYGALALTPAGLSPAERASLLLDALILDEFQVCHRGPLSGLPSLLQAQVDRLQDRNAAGGLIVLGSVQAEMEALLHDRRAPLFGRATFEMTLGPWDPSTIFEVCREHGAADPARCLTLCTLFGGVPKYWRHFAETNGLDTIREWKPWAQQVCERLFLRSDSPLREEGEGLLVRELRRNYLAILRTLAERPSCTHAELQDARFRNSPSDRT